MRAHFTVHASHLNKVDRLQQISIKVAVLSGSGRAPNLCRLARDPRRPQQPFLVTHEVDVLQLASSCMRSMRRK